MAAQRNVAYSSGRDGIRQKSSSSSLRSSHSHHISSKKSSNVASNSSASSTAVSNMNFSQPTSSGSQSNTNNESNGGIASKNRNLNTTSQPETPKNHILPSFAFYDTFAVFFILLQFPSSLRIAMHIVFIFVLSPSVPTILNDILHYVKNNVWPLSYIFRTKHYSGDKQKNKTTNFNRDEYPDFENIKDTKHASADFDTYKASKPITFTTLYCFFKTLVLDFLFAVTTIYFTPILHSVVVVFSTAIVAASLGGGPHPIIHAVYATSIVEILDFFRDRVQYYWAQDFSESASTTNSLSDIDSSIDLTVATQNADSMLYDMESKNKPTNQPPQQSQKNLKENSESVFESKSTTQLFKLKNKNQHNYIPEAAIEAASSLFSEIVKQSLAAAAASTPSFAVNGRSISSGSDFFSSTTVVNTQTSGPAFDDHFNHGFDGVNSAVSGGRNADFSGKDQTYNTLTSVASIIPNFIYFAKNYNWRTEFPVLLIQMVAIYVIWLSLKQYLSLSSSSSGPSGNFGSNLGNTEFMEYQHYEDADGMDGNVPFSEDVVYRDVVEINVDPSVANAETASSDAPVPFNDAKRSKDAVASPNSFNILKVLNSLFGLSTPTVSTNPAVNKRTALAFKRMSLTKSNQPLWATLAQFIIMYANLDHLPGIKPIAEDSAQKGLSTQCFLDSPVKSKYKGTGSNELIKRPPLINCSPISGVFIVYIFQTVVGLVITNVRYPDPSYYSVNVNHVFWKQIVVKPLYLSDTLMSIVPQKSKSGNDSSDQAGQDFDKPVYEGKDQAGSDQFDVSKLDPNSIFIAVHGLPAGAVYEIDIYFAPPNESNKVLIGHNSLCTKFPYEGYYQFCNPPGTANNGNNGISNNNAAGTGSVNGVGSISTSTQGSGAGAGGSGASAMVGGSTVAPPSRPLSPVTTLLDSFTQMVTVLSQTRELTKKMKKEHSKRIAGLKAEVDAARLKKESLEKSDERSRRRLEELHETIDTLKNDIQTFQSQIGGLEAQEKEVGKKYEEATKSYDAKMKSAMATRSREKQAEAKMLKQLDEVKADKEALVVKRDKVLARKEKLDADIKETSKEVETGVETFIDSRKDSREKKQQRRKLVATEFSDAIDKMEESVKTTQAKTTELWAEVQARSLVIQQAQQLNQNRDHSRSDSLTTSPNSPFASPTSLSIQNQQLVQPRSYGYDLSSTHSGHSIPLTAQVSSGTGIVPARSYGSIGAHSTSMPNSSSFSVPNALLNQMQISSTHISDPIKNSSPTVAHSHIGPISAPIAVQPITGPFTSTIHNTGNQSTGSYSHISGPISGPFSETLPNAYSGYIPGTITGPPVFPYAQPESSSPLHSSPSHNSTTHSSPNNASPNIPNHTLGSVVPGGTPNLFSASLTSHPDFSSRLSSSPGASSAFVKPISLTSSSPQNTSPQTSSPLALNSNMVSSLPAIMTIGKTATENSDSVDDEDNTLLQDSMLTSSLATTSLVEKKIYNEEPQESVTISSSSPTWSEALKSPAMSFKNLTISAVSPKSHKAPKSPKSPKTPKSPKFSIPEMAAKLAKSSTNRSTSILGSSALTDSQDDKNSGNLDVKLAPFGDSFTHSKKDT